MNPHLLFPILFVIAFIFWFSLNKVIVKLFDKFERNNADH